MNITTLQNIFSGEISPLISARLDSPAHVMGAKTLENFIPFHTGGLKKRPGTRTCASIASNINIRRIITISDSAFITLSRNTSYGTFHIDLYSSNYSSNNTASDEAGYSLLFSTTYSHPDSNFNSDTLDNLQYAVTTIDTNTFEIWLTHNQTGVFKIKTSNSQIFSVEKVEFTEIQVPGTITNPSAIAFFAGRLCLGGFKEAPGRIWLSRSPDSKTGQFRYTDFRVGTINSQGNVDIVPSDAIRIEENDMIGSRIRWFFGSRLLLTATEKALWQDTGDVPTPMTFDMNIFSHAGSNNIQPVALSQLIIYVSYNSRQLRAIVWDNNAAGGFIDISISDHATHLFEDGIKQIAVTHYPTPTVWILTNGITDGINITKPGILISCVIDQANGTFSFSKHLINAAVIAMNTVRNPNGDHIILAVRRNNNPNNTSYNDYIEVINLNDKQVNEAFNDYYVDAGIVFYQIVKYETITVPEQLRYCYLHIIADGNILPPVKADADGVIKLPFPVNTVHAGLPIKSRFEPTQQVIPANGTSYGKKRRIDKLILSLFRSLGGKVGVTEDTAETIKTKRYGVYELGEAPELYTGDVEITMSGNIDTKGQMVVVHEEPAPFNLIAIAQKIAILEG